jgi:hypothetical protein
MSPANWETESYIQYNTYHSMKLNRNIDAKIFFCHTATASFMT